MKKFSDETTEVMEEENDEISHGFYANLMSLTCEIKISSNIWDSEKSKDLKKKKTTKKF